MSDQYTVVLTLPLLLLELAEEVIAVPILGGTKLTNNNDGTCSILFANESPKLSQHDELALIAALIPYDKFWSRNGKARSGWDAIRLTTSKKAYRFTSQTDVTNISSETLEQAFVQGLQAIHSIFQPGTRCDTGPLKHQLSLVHDVHACTNLTLQNAVPVFVIKLSASRTTNSPDSTVLIGPFKTASSAQQAGQDIRKLINGKMLFSNSKASYRIKIEKYLEVGGAVLSENGSSEINVVDINNYLDSNVIVAA